MTVTAPRSAPHAVIADAPTQLLINGVWVDAADGGTLDVVDPATGDVLTSVASASDSDADAAVEAAAAAAAGWARTAPRQRSEILRRVFELMTAQADNLARLIVLENGKTLTDARGEILYAAEFFRWYAEEAVRLTGEVQVAPSGANRIVVVRQPIGISLLITPWNFPAAMATRKIGPALAAGCTVILKPASETPLTALAIGALIVEAGAPAGVVNVIPSRRSSAIVARMLADPRVRKLSFTGSTEVGKILLSEAAKTVVSCSMELGGNAPFVVFDDADLEAAIAGAMIAKMRNGGEACTAANRFYVQDGIADAFANRLSDAMGALQMGSGLDDGVQLGPLINESSRQKIAAMVDESVAAGALILTGGAPVQGPGFYYPPTVLTDVPSGSPVLTQEIFGPVAPIVRFSTEAQAVELANSTEYGLVGYVYTRDLRRGLRVSEAIDSGMIGLNRGIVSDPAAPFGGVKESGVGREGGHEGMLEFTESKYIAVEW